MVWGMGLLAAGSVVLGVAPQLAVNYLLNPILGALGMGAGVHVTWLGLSADAGSFSSTGGLVLALVSLVLGGVIYAIAYAARPATAAVGRRAWPARVEESLPAASRSPIRAASPPATSLRSFRSTGMRSSAGPMSIASISPSGAACRRSRAGSASPSRLDGARCRHSPRRLRCRSLRPACAGSCLDSIHSSAGGDAARSNPADARLPLSPSLPQRSRLLLSSAHPAMVACLLQSASGCRRNYGLRAHRSPTPWARLGLPRTRRAVSPSRWSGKAARIAIRKTHLPCRRRHLRSDRWSQAICSSSAGQLDWARALLLTSICVKLAAVPLFFWLLALADELPALVLGLIIAVVDMAAFGELYIAAQAIPGLLHARRPLARLCRRSPRCSPRCSCSPSAASNACWFSPRLKTSASCCSAVASASLIGIQGALIAASTHALAKALLFTCLAAPEAAGALDAEPIALAHALPGQRLRIPLRHAGHARHSAHARLHRPLEALLKPPSKSAGPLAAVFILSSILALIAYALALDPHLVGTRRHEDSPPASGRTRAIRSSKPPSSCWSRCSSPPASGPACSHMLMGVRP